MLVTRYGEAGLHHVGSLAQCMPRFAFLLSLLVMAAMGLPAFGLFAGFMGMLFHHATQVSWDLAIIALTWLFGGLCFLDLMRRIFLDRSTGLRRTSRIGTCPVASRGCWLRYCCCYW
jgi:NADH-quinone oxidoreductase subunit M